MSKPKKKPLYILVWGQYDQVCGKFKTLARARVAKEKCERGGNKHRIWKMYPL